jgi:hypothetical protein
MTTKFKKYLRTRFRDPVSWFAISIIGAWVVSAIFGLPPYQILNMICFAFAAGEWWSLVSWWKKRHGGQDHIETLAQASERWKIATVILIATATFMADLWLASSTVSALAFGLSILGVSSVITLWYAWSKPIVVTNAGLVIGPEIVEWSDVRRITWNDSKFTRIDFVYPNYFYGAKIRLIIPPEQALRLDSIVPASVDRGGTPADLRRITA